MDKTPKTAEERKEVTKQLINFAKIAIHTKQTKGIFNYIKGFNNSHIEAQIIQWFSLYTPIRLFRNKMGDEFFRVLDTVQSDYDLGPAHLNPYYSIEVKVKPIIYPAPKVAAPRKYGLSDREFNKKIIQSALSKFLSDPSNKNKNSLIEKIHQFSNESSQKKGNPTVSGGLPSLGKNR